MQKDKNVALPVTRRRALQTLGAGSLGGSSPIASDEVRTGPEF